MNILGHPTFDINHPQTLRLLIKRGLLSEFRSKLHLKQVHHFRKKVVGIYSYEIYIKFVSYFASNRIIYLQYVVLILIFLQEFRKFLRVKDGNEDEPETEIGEDFEILLQFVLDCRQLPATEVIEKYFVEDSTLSLSNNALRKELKSGSKDPEKLKVAEDDVKNVSTKCN